MLPLVSINYKHALRKSQVHYQRICRNRSIMTAYGTYNFWFGITHKNGAAIVCSVLCFPVTNLCAIMNPATGECRFTPFVGVMCVTLFEKLSLLIAAATLVVNIIFLITR